MATRAGSKMFTPHLSLTLPCQMSPHVSTQRARLPSPRRMAHLSLAARPDMGLITSSLRTCERTDHERGGSVAQLSTLTHGFVEGADRSGRMTDAQTSHSQRNCRSLSSQLHGGVPRRVEWSFRASFRPRPSSSCAL